MRVSSSRHVHHHHQYQYHHHHHHHLYITCSSFYHTRTSSRTLSSIRRYSKTAYENTSFVHHHLSSLNYVNTNIILLYNIGIFTIIIIARHHMSSIIMRVVCQNTRTQTHHAFYTTPSISSFPIIITTRHH